jgi:hypothetical protein
MQKRKSSMLLYVLLVAISLVAPLVSFAGVSLIYPGSTITANVNTSPPITWAQGQDYSKAQTYGFASSFTASNNAGSFTLTVSGLSGGTVTIDKLLNCSATSAVSTFKIQISSALSGSLSPTPTTLKLRFWTGATAPTADGSTGVITVLDLTQAQGTQTAATISGSQTVYVQIVVTYASATTGSSTVSIQPSSIVMA